MTIEEEISKEEALAYSFGERYKRLGEPVGDLQELEAEHRQMAEWLKKLQAYEEAREKIELKADKCPKPEIRYGMRYALYVQEKCIEEVNADDSNRCES